MVNPLWVVFLIHVSVSTITTASLVASFFALKTHMWNFGAISKNSLRMKEKL